MRAWRGFWLRKWLMTVSSPPGRQTRHASATMRFGSGTTLTTWKAIRPLSWYVQVPVAIPGSGPLPRKSADGGCHHAAVVPRSCRLKEAMSRLRKRHCRPFLNAGRTLLRASSFTVSGLQSRISATSLLFSKMSTFSTITRYAPEGRIRDGVLVSRVLYGRQGKRQFTRFFNRLNHLVALSPLRLAFLEIEHDRARHIDRRVRAHDEPDQQGEREAVDHGTTQQKERRRHEDRRTARDERAGERLVDRQVHDRREAVAPHLPHVLADAVRHDDRVVHRVADHGQQGGDRGQIE